MSKNKIRILIVDDEPKSLYIIRINLERRGYEVIVAQDGEKAVALAASEDPDLIILDIMMPRLDGFTACQQIRQFSTAPIIMLTALAEDMNKVKGLDLGADDYVTKPFSIEEFLARVRAVLRRVEQEKQPQTECPIFQANELRVDLMQKQVFVDGQEVRLTNIEFCLLSELVNHAGQMLSTEHLLAAVWGVGYEGQERTLRQAIYRLRQKIEPDPKNPRYVQTHSGFGYVFVV